MQFIKNHKIFLLSTVVVFLAAGVVIGFIALRQSGIAPQNIIQNSSSSFPDISTFKTNPANLFIISDADFTKYISWTSPFFGTNSSCAHSGGHINFTSTGAPYEVNLIAPVDGVISRVDNCFNLGTNDKFDVSLNFAQYQNNPVSLDYSIEPFAGLKCANNPDFYKQYIFVTEGQQVKAGDIIAKIPKFAPEGGTHVHFNLSANGKMTCPNIFSQAIVNEFASKNQNGCNGQPITQSTFCYLPGPGEDLLP